MEIPPQTEQQVVVPDVLLQDCPMTLVLWRLKLFLYSPYLYLTFLFLSPSGNIAL